MAAARLQMLSVVGFVGLCLGIIASWQAGTKVVLGRNLPPGREPLGA